MAKKIKKIELEFEQLKLLVCESIFQTKVYCSDENWKLINPSLKPLNNVDSIFQEGEVISNNTLVILMSSSQKILDIWKGQNVEILYPYIHSNSLFEIRIEILSPSRFYLLFDLQNIKANLGFLIHSLAKEMLVCFNSYEKPTEKGKVIENLIDRLLDKHLFLDQHGN